MILLVIVKMWLPSKMPTSGSVEAVLLEMMLLAKVWFIVPNEFPKATPPPVLPLVLKAMVELVKFTAPP